MAAETDTVEIEPIAEGNTGTSARRRHNDQLVRWAFTLFLTEQTVGIEFSTASTALTEYLGEYAKEYYYQLEKAPSTNKLHFQGCMTLKCRMSMKQVVDAMGGAGIHVEPCRNWSASKKYCQKEDTRVQGPWSHDHAPTRFEHALQATQLRPWQQYMLELLQQPPDDRHVMWVYDQMGGNGKTAFALYMYDNYGAGIYNTGKDADIAYAYHGEKIVIFDFMRSRDHVSYQTLESMKNGFLFSGKYESKGKRFNPPHVLCFANWLPAHEMLSADRWIIWKLDNNTLTKETTEDPGMNDVDEIVNVSSDPQFDGFN